MTEHNHKKCSHQDHSNCSHKDSADHFKQKSDPTVHKNPSERPYVHLHVHTEYSLLDGINKVNRLPAYAKKLGMPAVAMTDHGNISGSYKFYKECKKQDIKPIIGMEAYYTVNDRTAKEPDHLGKSYYHLILLAQNNTGLHNLIKLSSYAYTEGMYRKPRIDDTLIAEYSEGLIATTTCLGSRASQLILMGENKAAESLILHHKEMFKDRFLVELQLHKDEEQQQVNEVLQKIAFKHNLPMVLTCDCHYTQEHDKMHHEAALCLQTKTTLSNEKRFSFGDIDVHFASHDWTWNHAKQQGMPYDVISNTVHLSEMIDSDTYFMDRMNRYPKFQELPENMTSLEFLTLEAQHGLYDRFGAIPPEAYKQRLNHELRVIKKMGFADYMLIVSQFMNGARDYGVMHGPGRGSAAGSLIAYALKITEIDPIKYDLVFERFLNIGRAAKPLIFNREMAKTADSSAIPF